MANTKKFTQYLALPEHEKKIMQLKALSYPLTTKGEFTQLVKKVELRDKANKKIYPPSLLNPILEKLKRAGLLNKSLDCTPKLIHEITSSLVQTDYKEARKLFKLIKDNLHVLDSLSVRKYESMSRYNAERSVRIAYYQNNESFFKNSLETEEDCLLLIKLIRRLFYSQSLEEDWVLSRSHLLKILFCFSHLVNYYESSDTSPPPKNQAYWLDYYRNSLPTVSHPFLQYLSWQIALRLGLHQEIEKEIIPKRNKVSCYQLATQGSVAFINGHPEEALGYYHLALKLYRKQRGQRNWFFEDMHGFFFALLLIAVEKNYQSAEQYIRSALRQSERTDRVIELLLPIIVLEKGDRKAALYSYRSNDHGSQFHKAFAPLVCFWMDNLSETHAQEIAANFKRYQKNEPFFAYLSAGLVHDKPENEAMRTYLQTSPFHAMKLHQLIRVKPAWEYQLDRLSALMGAKTEQGITTHASQFKRLIWVLDPDAYELEPVEQKRTKTGAWGKGRAVSLSRFIRRDDRLAYLTDHDWRIAAGIEEEYSWSRYNEEYHWNLSLALPQLVGHPLIFHRKNTSIPLEVTKGEIELHIDESPQGGYSLSLSAKPNHGDILLQQQSQNSYQVISFSDADQEVADLIPDEGLVIPESAKNIILELIQKSTSSIKIHSDLGDEGVETVPAYSDCCLQMMPFDEGLKANVWVRPFKDQGPYLRPTQGRQNIIASLQEEGNEVRKRAARTFEKEQESFNALLENCPALSHGDTESYEWYFDTPLDCLELLSDLENYQQSSDLVIEWPKGESYRLQKKLTAKDFQFSINSNQQWFEYAGEVQIDDKKTMELQTLMELLDSGHGRFIELQKGAFVELTANLKKQLDELRIISEGNRVYRLGSGALQTLVEDMEDTRFDKEWANHLKQLKDMEGYRPEVPKSLQANLRDYQIDGFHYLAKLAHWGLGSCLADDMGLGKTLQAITILLEQGQHGPSLVVAPTSVCFNWAEELQKFAPSLTVHSLSSGNRETLITDAGNMDVLICSYGLLVQLREALEAKAWRVVILDEAQAIKNAATKRWKAAVNLPSHCRIALTGTPIENHLGELWSIFRFINPGLLSTQKQFQERFSNPIEKDQNQEVKKALKNLVKPFLLRRIKSEVLDELPPKTEQTIMIEPTAEETAFYEAVRLKALERIGRSGGMKKANEKHFSILAEIGRLRMACCDSSLVETEISIANSKIKNLLSIIENLRENNHRALVFSQFVKYLSLVKKKLDEASISYQYIDGKTPAKKRKEAVQAFQAGEGDLFLLSLKAGGTGLNLTAADYVIHLDPWWNPAVEDQASDRAHRIGQERPVTVYRLIMQNTIEEKIINMHGNKRELAADLLSGSDMTGKLTEEDLLVLIG